MAIKVADKAKSQYSTLHDLLILKLRVLHDVENQIIEALPKMAKAASDEKLKAAFTQHLEETKAQEQRIDEALGKAGDTSKKKETSEGMRGIIEDAEWCIDNIKDPQARDVSLIAAAQYVEHYEIAGYGSALAWAEEMGHSEICSLLQTTLDEESAADTKLSKLAEGLMGIGGLNKKVESGMDD